MKKKILCFIMIFAAIAAVFALASCGKKNNDSETTSETTDIVAELPYINDFKCAYYDVNGEKIEDKSAVLTSDELWVKTNFTLLPDAYAEGKGRFTLKFILSADFVGKIVSANSSATSDKDFTATFTADDKKSKNCEIELRIKINYSTGSFKIVYAYDDEVYTEACELPLNNNKTLLYTYDEATDGYIVSRDSNGSRWLANTKEVYLPDLYDGKPITVIDEELFKDCGNLTNVEVPDSVIRVESGAFSGCDKLRYNEYENAKYLGNEQNPYIILIKIINTDVTAVEINQTTAVIYDSAFSGCSRLTNLTIPNSVTCIGDEVFSSCVGLINIAIPDSMISVGKSAFSGCDNLKYNEYENAKYLGNENNLYVAFIELINAGIQYVDINAATKVICENAFYGYGNLTSIALPNSITSIDKSVFEDCSSLTDITIPDSVRSIGEGAFSGCGALTDIAIPNGVNAIRKRTFNGCSGLISVTIPDSVNSIGESAFNGCSSLTNITIPDSVNNIGKYAFSGCSALTSITIPDRITTIEERSFSECSGLTSITITKSVTTIGKYAFFDCSGLTSMVIENGVITIEKCAFSGCISLTNITIPDSVTSIEDGAFSSCDSLKNISISNNITSIGSTAFLGCDNLQYNEYGNAKYLGNEQNPYLALIYRTNAYITSAKINGATKIIQDMAFSSCHNLKSVTMSDNVAYIGDYAFSDCWSLTSITIPDGVTCIEYGSFRNCQSLTSITIPDSVTTIEIFAFAGCSGLKKVILPDNVTNIGTYAFSGCSGLKSLAIPNSVTIIGGNAFQGCSSLTNITIPDSVTKIGGEAFTHCVNLTSISFSGTKEKWLSIVFATERRRESDSGKTIVYCFDGYLKFDFSR